MGCSASTWRGGLRRRGLPPSLCVLFGAATLLVACGDDSGGDVETFCEEGAPAVDSFHAWIEGDLSRSELDQMVDAMTPVDPPAEVADQWDSLVDALATLRDADPGDPQAVADATAGVEAQLGEEMRRVDDYVLGSC
jgi:hypothetical protein